jgi:hypothetical protein
MTTANIQDFVRREIALKQSMTFGEWLRHIRHSHDDLLRLLTGEADSSTVEVTMVVSPSTAHSCTLPKGCARILIDARCEPIIVRGFLLNAAGVEVQHDAMASCRTFLEIAQVASETPGQ